MSCVEASHEPLDDDDRDDGWVEFSHVLQIEGYSLAAPGWREFRFGKERATGIVFDTNEGHTLQVELDGHYETQLREAADSVDMALACTVGCLFFQCPQTCSQDWPDKYEHTVALFRHNGRPDLSSPDSWDLEDYGFETTRVMTDGKFLLVAFPNWSALQEEAPVNLRLTTTDSHPIESRGSVTIQLEGDFIDDQYVAISTSRGCTDEYGRVTLSDVPAGDLRIKVGTMGSPLGRRFFSFTEVPEHMVTASVRRGQLSEEILEFQCSTGERRP